ncbi:hypothetical protein LS684_06320 [Cytobacillus spongiae]|jgi:hypothetical protein|uniref:hypothetical protein n=1 Tax=Cytobacillus spongiae TaxID=2901381 RepID=UPI001F2397B6|nr:hypothetical protein [Cytobacillus spongiae]UII57051.1 hypothetical protein LS684_06320 [Cytobacillus spongiae]
MGYIAPIIHYQYDQYANRELSNDYDPFTFLPIHSIKQIKNGQTPEQEQNKFKQNLKIKQTKKAIDQQFIEQALAEVTGKGQLFNECV